MVSTPSRNTELSRPRTTLRSPLSSLRHDLDRFFEDFWERNAISNWFGARGDGGDGGGGGTSFFPSLDISETTDTYRVTADLPGLRQEDVTVETQGDVLVISGSRREETKNDGRDYLCRECVTGAFRRVVRLDDANVSKARARMRDGVLEIDVPKTEDSSRRRRTIPIETSGPIEATGPIETTGGRTSESTGALSGTTSGAKRS